MTELYTGGAAASAVIELARSVHAANAAGIVEFLKSEADALFKIGDERGSSVHLVAMIALRRELLALATSSDEKGAAQNNLGIALLRLGERESGTARLEEAVAAFRTALEERRYLAQALALGLSRALSSCLAAPNGPLDRVDRKGRPWIGSSSAIVVLTKILSSD